MHHITLIGDGAMACVMALLLESRGKAVTVWGPHPDHVAEVIQTRVNRRYLPDHPLPESIRLTADDAGCFRKAELVVVAIPTQFIRPVVGRLREHVPAGVPIVSVAKGIENDTLLRPTQIIADVLGGERHGGTEARRHEETEGSDEARGPAPQSKILNPKSKIPLASLSGPSVADELARCLPATVAAASEDEDLAKALQDTFTTEWFRVYTNPDLLGVELAGALKNVIALAAGILDGLQAGINAKSALLSRGLAEITRLGVAMGANAETFFGLTGVGDLATTCFSPTGRNRSCGELLGRGKPLDHCLEQVHGVVEGVPTTRAVVQLAERHGVDMPITGAVHQVLFHDLDPLEAISHLMSRDPKAERVG